MKKQVMAKAGVEPSTLKRRSINRALLSSSLTLERILVPVDFSACSEKALHYATAFARQFKVNLVLLHVVEIFPIDYVLGLTTDTEESKQLVARAEAELSHLSFQCPSGRKWGIQTMVRLGKPYQEIVKAARECRVQHGDTRLHRIFALSTRQHC
jgi:hypothetical protein